MQSKWAEWVVRANKCSVFSFSSCYIFTIDPVSYAWPTWFTFNFLQEESRWLRYRKICTSFGALLPRLWRVADKESAMGWYSGVRGGKDSHSGHYSSERSWRAPLRCGKAVQSMFSSSFIKCWIVTKPPAFTLNPLIPHRIRVRDHRLTVRRILRAFWLPKWGRLMPFFVQHLTFRIAPF